MNTLVEVFADIFQGPMLVRLLDEPDSDEDYDDEDVEEEARRTHRETALSLMYAFSNLSYVGTNCSRFLYLFLQRNL
jgi:hypothetical protein